MYVAVTTNTQLLCNGSNYFLTVVSDGFNSSSMHIHVIGRIMYNWWATEEKKHEPSEVLSSDCNPF